MERAVMLLPQPLSPTIPSTRLRWMLNETPSTAFSTPSSSLKWVRRSLISSRMSVFITAPLLVGIGCVAQTVANEIEHEYRRDDEQAGCQHPGLHGDAAHILRVLHQRAPANGWRADAQAEETECSFR